MKSKVIRDTYPALRQHRIIVGVDYGTTFTGASYVRSNGKVDDITVISTWPGSTRDEETVIKTPSRIAYTNGNEKITRPRWGFQVEPGMKAYSWTKLLLDRNTPLTDYDDPLLELSSGIGILKLPEDKDAVQVAADFLTEVYQHIMKIIAREITEETLSITPLEFWFTVPAIWSDDAVQATNEAARLAGFGASKERPDDSICMISEPEAAAIATLKHTSKLGIGQVKAGDVVMVCDCGGGTVDITTYLLKQVDPTLEFGELCIGIGGKCGSTAIDRNFFQLMSNQFGKSFEDIPLTRRGPGSQFMKYFERIKKDFGYDKEETTYELPLNMAPAHRNPEYFNEDERLVMISNDDLHGVFDPVVSKIIQLVEKQIKDVRDKGHHKVNRIMLVGGFGDCEYLRTKFKQTFGPDVAITIPRNPQAAVVQGAAIRGLEDIYSQTRRCRRYYGFTLGQEFRQGIDDEKNSYIDRWNGDKMAKGYMRWMIARGQKYSENQSYKQKIYRSYIRGESRKFATRLYSCMNTEAPDRVEHQDIHEVGEISVDFSKVNFNIFERRKFGSGWLYKLDYSIKVIFGAREGILKFEAHAQGQIIGSTKINFMQTRYY